MMASIAKYKGMKWSYKNGLTDRVTGKLISKDPDQIGKILVGGSAKDLENVESIVAKIKTDPNYQDMTQELRARMAKCESEEASSARERDDMVTECTSLLETSRQNAQHKEKLEERLRVATQKLSRSETSALKMKQDFESKRQKSDDKPEGQENEPVKQK